MNEKRPVESDSPEELDREQRPQTYFGMRTAQQELLAGIRGTALRASTQARLRLGEEDEVRAKMVDGHDQAESVKALEARHPMFMGGNYLPELEVGEVEIVRITISSVTWDVACVYARAEGGRIRYRVVDEYAPEFELDPSQRYSDMPLTLGVLADLFLGHWDLPGFIRMNYGEDLDAGLGFFATQSDFYPQFGQMCTLWVVEAYHRRYPSALAGEPGKEKKEHEGEGDGDEPCGSSGGRDRA